MQRTVTFIILIFLGMTGLTAQGFSSKGVPFIKNYSPEQYGEAGKVWAITSTDNGLVYCATDQGLLEFDGQRWIHHSGSKGFTRSLLMTSDSTGYSGADKDFGGWQRNAAGQFAYASHNPYRKSTKGLNEEFWGTYRLGEDIVFVSYDNLYVSHEEQLIKIAAPSRFYGSTASAGKVYLFDEATGLHEFDGQSLTALFNFPDAASPPKIVDIQQWDGGLFIVTRGQGTFRFAEGKLTALNQEITPHLQRDQVFSFSPIGREHYAFGTIFNGVYITDLEGRIIQHINKQKGLLNNTILSLHYSQQGRLWVGMDFGISAIELNSDVTYFLDQRGQLGTSQTGLLHDGTFYLGTNQGLYTTSWEQLSNKADAPDFRRVPGSAGQVWALSLVDGKILCGHDRGLFQVSGDRFQQLHDEPGVLSISQPDKEHLITGNYNGISLFLRTDDRWAFARKISPVQGAVNQVLPQGGEALWLSLPNFGLLKASLGPDYTITDQQIFPADQFSGPLPQLFRDTTGLKVMTERKTYAFDNAAQTFAPVTLPRVGHPVHNSRPGIYRPTALNAAYGFVPIHNGFALKKTDYSVAAMPAARLVIRTTEAFDTDSSRLLAPAETAPYRFNNLRFHYAVPQQDHALYQYQLDGHTTGWSSWTKQTNVRFLDLPAGDYTFRLRAKVNDTTGPEQTVAVTIGSPWYRTTWAYVLYGLLVLAALYLNYRWQQHQLKRQKVQLEANARVSRRLAAAAEEQENLQKRYGMLETGLGEVKKQLRSKTIELARKAKENDEKGRILQSLKEKVDGLLAQRGNTGKFEWQKVSRILENFPDTEDNSFSLQLEELHQGFLTTLSQRFTDLTTYDLRLCAYLKSGLTTREIAELMNVLPSSVNVSRSRLRKKLELAPKEDLFRFLRGVE